MHVADGGALMNGRQGGYGLPLIFNPAAVLINNGLHCIHAGVPGNLSRQRGHRHLDKGVDTVLSGNPVSDIRCQSGHFGNGEGLCPYADCCILSRFTPVCGASVPYCVSPLFTVKQ